MLPRIGASGYGALPPLPRLPRGTPQSVARAQAVAMGVPQSVFTIADQPPAVAPPLNLSYLEATQAGLPLAVLGPAAAGLLARFGPSILRLLGLVGAGYAGYEVAGGGEGGGFMGLNILGGQEGYIPGTVIPLGGPGAPEPPAALIAKEWSTGTARFYMLIDGRICCRKKNGVWKIWRPKKHIVLPRGTTTLAQAVKAQVYLDRMWRTVAKRTKALKLA